MFNFCFPYYFFAHLEEGVLKSEFPYLASKNERTNSNNLSLPSPNTRLSRNSESGIRGAYCYGFNGKDRESEFSSGAYDFGARIHDARLGRWMSVDMYVKEYVGISSYSNCYDNPVAFVDPDGRTILLADEFSKEIFIEHLKSVFELKNGTSPMAEVFLQSLTGKQLDYDLIIGDDKRRQFDKSFRKAMRGLDRDQRKLARGYLKLIKSDPVLKFKAIDENHPLNEDKVTKAQLDESGGGITVQESRFSKNCTVVVDVGRNKEVTVNDDNGNSVKEECSDDEAITHEVLGHGLGINLGLDNSYDDEYSNSRGINDITSIQVSNIVRRIEGKSHFRNGKDHFNTTSTSQEKLEMSPEILNK